MFSKKEASQLRKEFWMIFGQYMSPVLSSEGEKINWINYKTGVKGLQFKMNVVQDAASISIEITHPDVAEQKIIFEKLLHVKLKKYSVRLLRPWKKQKFFHHHQIYWN